MNVQTSTTSSTSKTTHSMVFFFALASTVIQTDLASAAEIFGTVSYTGTQTGSVRIVAGNAPDNRVLALDGTGDYVALDGLVYDQVGQITDLTVEAWIKTSSDRQGIILSWDRSAAWEISVTSNPTSSTDGLIGFASTDETGEVHDLIGVLQVNDGRWHHVAVSYESATGTKRIFIDGVQDAFDDQAHSPGLGLVGGSEIGTRYGFVGTRSESSVFNGTVWPTYHFQGQIDEVRIWNRVVGETELADEMFTTLTGTESGLVGLWSFDDGTANDRTANAYQGTLVEHAAIVGQLIGVAEESTLTEPGAYTLTNLSPADYSVIAFRDSNQNNLRDPWEAFGLSPLNPVMVSDDVSGVDITLVDPDSDVDNVPDHEENFVHRTDANNDDTDNDGITDGDEIGVYHTDPLDEDSDGDRLSDGDEILVHSTDPLLADTDEDFVKDGSEVAAGTNPLLNSDTPAMAPVLGETVSSDSVVLKWSPLAGVTWYQIWINHEGEVYLHQWLNQTETYYELTENLPCGNLEWWVRGWGPTDGLTFWSFGIDFQVPCCEPQPPELVAPRDLSPFTPSIYVSTADECSTSYDLWISRGGSFFYNELHHTGPVEEGIVLLRPIAEPPIFGRYAWWVRGRADDGTFGPWSDGAEFSYGLPVPVAPVGTQDTQMIELEWSTQFTSEATWYHLSIFKDGSTVCQDWVEASEARKEGINLSYALPEQLAAGRYSWSLKAWQPNDSGPESPRLDFSIPCIESNCNEGKGCTQLPEVEIREPSDGNGGFVWKPISEGDGKLVVILPSGEFRKKIATVTIRSSAVPVSGNRIEAGYFATDTANGNRPHYRFLKRGAEYGKNIFLVVTKSNGEIVSYRIPDGAKRWD